MLISLLIYLLVSNALTTRRDKSILFSRIVIMNLIMASFLVYNNLYLNPLNKGIGIYGGFIHITTFTQIFELFILLVSTAILTLNVVYPEKFYLERLKTRMISVLLSFTLRLPFLFGLTELNTPYMFVIIAPLITLTVINVVSHLTTHRFLNFRQSAPIVLFAIAVCSVTVLLREYGFEWPLILFIGEITLVSGLSGLFSVTGIPPASHLSPPRVATSSGASTLNSDQASNPPTGSESNLGGASTNPGTPYSDFGPVLSLFQGKNWYPLSKWTPEQRAELRSKVPQYVGSAERRLTNLGEEPVWGYESKAKAARLAEEIRSMDKFDYAKLSNEGKQYCDILFAGFVHQILGKAVLPSSSPDSYTFYRYLRKLS